MSKPGPLLPPKADIPMQLCKIEASYRWAITLDFSEEGVESHAKYIGCADRLGERELALCHRAISDRFFLNSALHIGFPRCGDVGPRVAAAFIFYTYYPHGLPLPTSVTAQKAAPAGPAAPPPRSQ